MAKVVKALPQALINAATAFVISGFNPAAAGIAFAGSLALGTAANLMAGSSNPGQGAFTQPLNIRFGDAGDEQRVWGYGRVSSGGTRKWSETTGENNKFLWLVNAYHDTPIAGFEDFYANKELVPIDVNGAATGRYAGVLNVYRYYGPLNQDAATYLVAASSTWTANHRLMGIANDVIKLTRDDEKYPSGVPTFLRQFLARPLWDLREDPAYGNPSGSHRRHNELTWEWTQNATLAAIDYVLGVKLNGVFIGGVMMPIDGLDIDLLITAANVCDEDVVLAGGGTEKRYTINGLVGSLEDKMQVFQAMLLAMAAVPTVRNGKLGWIVGAAQPATVHLTDADLAGPLTVNPSRSFQDKHNTITSQCYDRLSDSGTADLAPLRVAEYVAADGGITLEREIRHRFTDSPATAQRINKIILANEREQLSIEAAFKPKAARIPLFGTFLWTSAAAGYAAQKMRLMHRERLPDGSFNLLARSETDAKYAWSESEELAPPNVTAVPQQAAPTPGAVQDFNAVAVSSVVQFSWSDLDPGYNYNILAAPLGGILAQAVPVQTGIRATQFSAPFGNGDYTFFIYAVNQLGVAGPEVSVDLTLTGGAGGSFTGFTQTFDAQSGEVPVPVNAASLTIKLWGAGGAGGQPSEGSGFAVGPGGGSGAYCARTYAIASADWGDLLTYTGSDGHEFDTTPQTACTCTGTINAGTINMSATAGYGQSGGAASGGTTNTNGTSGNIEGPATGTNGNGADAPASGGVGAARFANTTSAQNPGGGGGGSSAVGYPGPGGCSRVQFIWS